MSDMDPIVSIYTAEKIRQSCTSSENINGSKSLKLSKYVLWNRNVLIKNRYDYFSGCFLFKEQRSCYV